MAQALTPPFLLACVLLVVAGAGKLRSPTAAAAAVAVLGVGPRLGERGRRLLVRALALAEIALGAAGALHPSPAPALALACVYVTFALITLRLGRRRASCGCFGQEGAPASAGQSVLSLSLALVAGLGAVSAPRGLPWLLARPVPSAAILLIGLAGAVVAAALTYTELPRAWAAWGAR